MAHSGYGANNKSAGYSRDCDGVESASHLSRADDPTTNNHSVGRKTKLRANHLKLETTPGKLKHKERILFLFLFRHIQDVLTANGVRVFECDRWVKCAVSRKAVLRGSKRLRRIKFKIRANAVEELSR